MNAVVTGDIGAGKSTAVRAAMRQLGWTKPAGFFTHWDGKERGADVLFIETWTGEKRPFARRLAAPAVPGGLAYALEADAARWAAGVLAAAAPETPVVLDELGLIELAAPEFAAAVAQLFRGPAPVLAVIQNRALAPWRGIVGPIAAEHLFRVDAATRAALPAQLAALFRA